MSTTVTRTAVRTILVATVAIFAVTSLAGAAAFTVTLKNGNTFETRYQPSDVDWDDSVAMFLTDQGNPIVLKKSEIAEVTALAEAKGFGYQLNTTTLYLGWSPNDLVETGEDGKEKPTFDTGEGEEAPPQDFTIQQFVSVPVVGSAPLGGIPVTDTGGY